MSATWPELTYWSTQIMRTAWDLAGLGCYLFALAAGGLLRSWWLPSEE